jgi:hypothetical protein
MKLLSLIPKRADPQQPKLQAPQRQRLKPRSSYPRPARVRLSPGPLQRLAWAFGFRF